MEFRVYLQRRYSVGRGEVSRGCVSRESEEAALAERSCRGRKYDEAESERSP